MSETRQIAHSIAIRAGRATVWAVLVEPALIERWLSDADLAVTADWVVGGFIRSAGDWHGLPVENKAVITALETGEVLAYRHWSSLSQLPDTVAYYSSICIELADAEGGTTLSVRQENLLTPEIYGHWNFYWAMALDRIRRLAESGHL